MSHSDDHVIQNVLATTQAPKIVTDMTPESTTSSKTSSQNLTRTGYMILDVSPAPKTEDSTIQPEDSTMSLEDISANPQEKEIVLSKPMTDNNSTNKTETDCRIRNQNTRDKFWSKRK